LELEGKTHEFTRITTREEHCMHKNIRKILTPQNTQLGKTTLKEEGPLEKDPLQGLTTITTNINGFKDIWNKNGGFLDGNIRF